MNKMNSMQIQLPSRGVETIYTHRSSPGLLYLNAGFPELEIRSTPPNWDEALPRLLEGDLEQASLSQSTIRVLFQKMVHIHAIITGLRYRLGIRVFKVSANITLRGRASK